MIRKQVLVFLAVALLITASSVIAGAQDQPRKMKIPANFDPNADDGAPKVDDVAPLFKLDLLFNDVANEKSIDLNELVGKQPILLVFGSYT